MDYLKSIPAVLLEWLPALITVLGGIVVISTFRWLLMKRKTPTSGSRITQQLLIAALSGVLVVMAVPRLGFGQSCGRRVHQSWVFS